VDPETKAEIEEMQKSKKGAQGVSTATSNLATRDYANEFATWMSGPTKKK
jgi:hypothetical protein